MRRAAVRVLARCTRCGPVLALGLLCSRLRPVATVSPAAYNWISFPRRHADRAGIGSYTAALDPSVYPIALSR